VCILKRLKEAITQFEIAKGICNEINEPEAAFTAKMLGDWFMQLKKCEHALKSYTKAIEKRLQTSNEYKTNSGLDRYDNAGKCLYVLKRFEEAITKSEIAKRIYNKIDHPLVTSTAN